MNTVIVVATRVDREDNDQVKVLLTEQHREILGRNILELPTGVRRVDSDESLEVVAARTLRIQTGYQSKRMVYLGEGAILPALIGDIVSFFLAVDIEKTNQIPLSARRSTENEETLKRIAERDIKVHEAPIIHIGPYTYKTGLMIAPTLWAGMYLRIAHLLTNPLDGTIQ